ncbi:PIN domain protein [Pseudomonas syringae pv. philadelphi]|nr:PIN domain protein [Pseudomonas cannabina pv. alisalensis]KPW54002.1 PIN domain protein [Pseudomonas syringae pv. berberidis]RMO92542.1 PIN domain protein [Pseudomonas syringae pv. philadelphi]RMU27224.1 PIN domain protein [Pseudomonas avellanae]RMU88543.1 PIN domain protein [Pseudomonas coronafaciens pv. porri]
MDGFRGHTASDGRHRPPTREGTVKGVLVDTSVWVEHFRNNSPELVNLLSQDRVLIHPMVIGELACGTPPDRSNTLTDLGDLRGAQQPTVSEVIAFLNTHKLYGLGCGLVDMTLLASALLSGTALWTLDKRLERLASRMAVSYQPPTH